jgi:hypothetical protein
MKASPVPLKGFIKCFAEIILLVGLSGIFL